MSGPSDSTIARIVAAIEEDLDDRRGFELCQLDDGILNEIREAWSTAISAILRPRASEEPTP